MPLPTPRDTERLVQTAAATATTFSSAPSFALTAMPVYARETAKGSQQTTVLSHATSAAGAPTTEKTDVAFNSSNRARVFFPPPRVFYPPPTIMNGTPAVPSCVRVFCPPTNEDTKHVLNIPRVQDQAPVTHDREISDKADADDDDALLASIAARLTTGAKPHASVLAPREREDGEDTETSPDVGNVGDGKYMTVDNTLDDSEDEDFEDYELDHEIGDEDDEEFDGDEEAAKLRAVWREFVKSPVFLPVRLLKRRRGPAPENVRKEFYDESDEELEEQAAMHLKKKLRIIGAYEAPDEDTPVTSAPQAENNSSTINESDEARTASEDADEEEQDDCKKGSEIRNDLSDSSSGDESYAI